VIFDRLFRGEAQQEKQGEPVKNMHLEKTVVFVVNIIE